jgi:Ca2+-binding RTX toxin-like protein
VAFATWWSNPIVHSQRDKEVGMRRKVVRVSPPRESSLSSTAAAASAAILIGGGDDETLTGTERADLIVGHGDNHVLSGLGGNDRVRGGWGPDFARHG